MATKSEKNKQVDIFEPVKSVVDIHMAKVLEMLSLGETTGLAGELAKVRLLSQSQAAQFAAYFGETDLIFPQPIRLFKLERKNAGHPPNETTFELALRWGRNVANEIERLKKTGVTHSIKAAVKSLQDKMSASGGSKKLSSRYLEDAHLKFRQFELDNKDVKRPWHTKGNNEEP